MGEPDTAPQAGPRGRSAPADKPPGGAMTSGPGGPGGPGAPPDRRGHYAGFVSRFVAYVVDLGVTTGLFTLALAAASFAASVVTGKTVNWDRTNVVVAAIFVGWLF